MAKFKGSVTTGFVGARKEFYFEIDEEDLEWMNDDDINEVAFEVMIQEIDWNYERIEE